MPPTLSLQLTREDHDALRKQKQRFYKQPKRMIVIETKKHMIYHDMNVAI